MVQNDLTGIGRSGILSDLNTQLPLQASIFGQSPYGAGNPYQAAQSMGNTGYGYTNQFPTNLGAFNPAYAAWMNAICQGCVPQGFVPQNFVPQNFQSFVPQNFIPQGFVPQNFIPQSYGSHNFVPQGFVPNHYGQTNQFLPFNTATTPYTNPYSSWVGHNTSPYGLNTAWGQQSHAGICR